jgi:hypothetical protein
MHPTKIQLSEDELLMMQNSDWILTKNGIIEKINQGFSSMAVQMQQTIACRQSVFDNDIILSSPKISRGEKYQGLPYVILDYPRIFGKENVLAIRTLFWWGNYYSITLHLKGRWQHQVANKIIASSRQLREHSFFMSLSGDEWNHDLQNEDYIGMQNISEEELEKKLAGTPFFKLAARVAIAPWATMEKKLFGLFLYLLQLMEG